MSLKQVVCCGIFRTDEELTGHILHHCTKVSTDSELITEHWSGLKEPESPSDTKHVKEETEEKGGDEQQGNCNETKREERSLREDEKVSKGEDRESRCDQACENGKSEVKGEERQFKKREKKQLVELGEWRETDSREEKMEVREEVEEDVREREQIGSAGVARSIQVLDGHIALGSVQWKDCRAQAAGRVQV